MIDYPKYLVVFVESGTVQEIQYEGDGANVFDQIKTLDDMYESYDKDRDQVTVLYKAVEIAHVDPKPRLTKTKVK